MKDMKPIPPWAAYMAAVGTIVIGVISYTHATFTTYREFQNLQKRIEEDKRELHHWLEKLGDKIDSIIERLPEKGR